VRNIISAARTIAGLGLIAVALCGCTAPWMAARRVVDTNEAAAGVAVDTAAADQTESTSANRPAASESPANEAPAQAPSQPEQPPPQKIDHSELVAELAQMLVEAKKQYRLADHAGASERNDAASTPDRDSSAARANWTGEQASHVENWNAGQSGGALLTSPAAPYTTSYDGAARPRYPEMPHENLLRQHSPGASEMPQATFESRPRFEPGVPAHADARDIASAGMASAPEQQPRSWQDLSGAGSPVARTAYEASGGFDESAHAAAQPLPREYQDVLDEAAALLEAELKGSQLDDEERTRREVALRLLRLASRRPKDWSKASAAIEHLDKSEKEFWTHLLYAMHVLLDAAETPRLDLRARLALIELRESQGRLGVLSTLEVRNLAFCTAVQSYGVYTEFPEKRFQPGQEVILYAEVENFAAEEKKDGFETAMEGTCEIYDASGRKVHVHDFDLDSEHSRNRRRDFFLPYRFWLPDKLLPGEYSLKLTVRDVKAEKMDQGTIKFAIDQRR
jgi:hypothetical protein